MVLAASDYLNMTAADAASQWRSIYQRTMVTTGRQVDFVPVETVLCLVLSRTYNHRRYGGSTAHLAEEPVPTLAKLFRRKNSSVLAKMANVDGSRSNGARAEIEVATTLMAEPARFRALCHVIEEGARMENVSIDLHQLLLIDEIGSLSDLLGQQELSQVDLPEEVAKAAQDLAEDKNLDLVTTQRFLISAARIGQYKFSRLVIANFDYSCGFCGMRIDPLVLSGSRLLLAGHIKPWRSCSNSERLDVRNGIAACPTHDAAFDTGLTSLGENFEILISRQLRDMCAADEALLSQFSEPVLRATLGMPKVAKQPADNYLQWHRAEVYRDTRGRSA